MHTHAHDMSLSWVPNDYAATIIVKLHAWKWPMREWGKLTDISALVSASAFIAAAVVASAPARFSSASRILDEAPAFSCSSDESFFSSSDNREVNSPLSVAWRTVIKTGVAHEQSRSDYTRVHKPKTKNYPPITRSDCYNSKQNRYHFR